MTDTELREWMIANGYSLSTLAGELGVHQRTVGRWRSGELPVPRMAELALQAVAPRQQARTRHTAREV